MDAVNGAVKLRMDKLAKQFALPNGERTTAVEDFSLDVREGEFMVLVGPSGCGKTTVLNLLAGLDAPTSGVLTIDGRPITGPGADRGVMFQDYALFPWRTVRENVEFGLRYGPAGHGMSADERNRRVTRYVELVHLEQAQAKYPHQLSGGMRQRVAIARTLILGPRIILMDEPFGALDPTTRLHMQALLVDLWREAEATVFFVTHSIEEAVYLGDRVYVFSGSPGTILKQIELPAPDRPPKEMQREPAFLKYVFEIRDLLDNLATSTRPGDD